MAQSQQFIRRARSLGFSEEAIAELPNRIRSYAGNIGESLLGGWADESKLVIGRFGVLSWRRQRIAHELGHVLDDIANPGLFVQARQGGFGFARYYNVERVAYTMQYGFNPLPITLINAADQAHPIVTRVIILGGAAGSGYYFYNGVIKK